MPTTPEAFILDTQGIALALTIYDIDGEPVTNCYSDLDSEGSPLEWPLTDYDPNGVTLYFTALDPPQIRSPYRARIRSDESATDYQVGATLNGVQVGGADGGYAPVEAHSWMPLTTLTIGFDDYELAHLLDGGGPGPGSDSLAIVHPYRGAYGETSYNAGDAVKQVELNIVAIARVDAPATAPSDSTTDDWQVVNPGATTPIVLSGTVHPDEEQIPAPLGSLMLAQGTAFTDGYIFVKSGLSAGDWTEFPGDNATAFPPDGAAGALLASDGADGELWTTQLPDSSTFGTPDDGADDTRKAATIYGRRRLVFPYDDGTTPALTINQNGSGYVKWAKSDGTEIGFYHVDFGDEYVQFVGTWSHATAGDTDGLGFYDVEPVSKTDRATIATQVGTVDVAAFNALRTALIALGLVIDGD